MADPLLHVNASVTCAHSGQASFTPSNNRVKVSGQSVVTVSDTCTVSGCSFKITAGLVTIPRPCTAIKWTVPATRVRVNGQPVLLKSSNGLGQSAEQIPQGAPNISNTQTRVRGT